MQTDFRPPFETTRVWSHKRTENTPSASYFCKRTRTRRKASFTTIRTNQGADHGKRIAKSNCSASRHTPAGSRLKLTNNRNPRAKHNQPIRFQFQHRICHCPCCPRPSVPAPLHDRTPSSAGDLQPAGYLHPGTQAARLCHSNHSYEHLHWLAALQHAHTGRYDGGGLLLCW